MFLNIFVNNLYENWKQLIVVQGKLIDRFLKWCLKILEINLFFKLQKRIAFLELWIPS